MSEREAVTVMVVLGAAVVLGILSAFTREPAWALVGAVLVGGVVSFAVHRYLGYRRGQR